MCRTASVRFRHPHVTRGIEWQMLMDCESLYRGASHYLVPLQAALVIQMSPLCETCRFDDTIQHVLPGYEIYECERAVLKHDLTRLDIRSFGLVKILGPWHSPEQVGNHQDHGYLPQVNETWEPSFGLNSCLTESYVLFCFVPTFSFYGSY